MAQLVGNRAERFSKHWEYIQNRLEIVISRLREAGVDIDDLEGYADTLESKAAVVQDAYEDLDAAIEGGDRDDIQSVQETVRSAREDLIKYYQDTLRVEIKSLIKNLKTENN